MRIDQLATDAHSVQRVMFVLSIRAVAARRLGSDPLVFTVGKFCRSAVMASPPEPAGHAAEHMPTASAGSG